MEENKEKKIVSEKTKSDKALTIIGWIILVVTLVSIVALVFITSILAFIEIENGEMPAGIPLSIQYASAIFISTLIFLAIIFALTYFFFWSPIKNHLEIRKNNIESNINAASFSRKEAEKNLEIAKQEKAKIKEEAKEIIADSKFTADKERKKILEKAKKEQELLLEKTRDQIEKEKAQLQDDIKQEILSTSLLAAEKIIEKELNSKSNQKMVNELIDSLK